MFFVFMLGWVFVFVMQTAQFLIFAAKFPAIPGNDPPVPKPARILLPPPILLLSFKIGVAPNLFQN